MREAGVALNTDRLEIVLTRAVLVQTMEALGEDYPATPGGYDSATWCWGSYCLSSNRGSASAE